jgi:hypothetical protein
VKAEPKTEGETKIKPIKADPEDKSTIKQEELTSTIGMYKLLTQCSASIVQ